ncbi:hypothetical protein HMPREF0762_01862 [Slackia exigua ATCC 700122]|uniref:Uncharacterized protein n=1 Tax=Slackia exigua (strain ATCC 700122 / DSM 15923 / CIP 105133 / JCM 11022 / KCTC 5966 / S-7) TaxID=649764 RepID=D0WJ37_SLAES|nr:hypothetical protein HMPREF0762_01862 [Slackia exigua ATCC 700122]
MFYMHDTMLQEGERGKEGARHHRAHRLHRARIGHREIRPSRPPRPSVKRGPHATKGRAVAQPFVRAQESPVVAGRA